jgi:hypothetical protein
MADFLGLLATSEGIKLVFTLFVPGFIFISSTRHWFDSFKFFKKLSEIEIVFWSIPLSAFFIIITSLPPLILGQSLTSIFLTSDPRTATTILGAFDSMIIFLLLLGIKLRGSKKLPTKGISLGAIYGSILLFSFYITVLLFNKDFSNQLWVFLRYNYILFYCIQLVSLIVLFGFPAILTHKIFKTKIKLSKYF